MTDPNVIRRANAAKLAWLRNTDWFRNETSKIIVLRRTFGDDHFMVRLASASLKQKLQAQLLPFNKERTNDHVTS